ncbi:kinase-like domain-containing protein [Phaeosphaeriaceae sp. PMI808]|nr:kinase-like domain-containing protein [Phaeosphaeriaceae sp. PMI808]
MSQIKWPTGCNQQNLVGWGNFGIVCYDSSTDTVVKFPNLEEHGEHIQVERAIYERFEEYGSHLGLLQYFGAFESGLRLEFASNYGLRKYIQDDEGRITFEQRLQWCEQIANALAFAHSKGVIHGDLEWANIFLDNELNAKVADFAGSSLDGSPLLIAVTASHRYSGPLLSKQADIFALGSTIYEVTCGQVPYAGLTDKEIRDLFQESKFPETQQLGPIGHVIADCWRGKYRNADKVATSIAAIRSSSNSRPKTFLCSKTISTIAI